MHLLKKVCVILSNQEHLFLVCKHKQMLKIGAPPHKFRVMYFSYGFPWFEQINRIINEITLYLVHGVISYFIDDMGSCMLQLTDINHSTTLKNTRILNISHCTTETYSLDM